MRITNNYKLPWQLVKAVESFEHHKRGDFSITELLQPTQLWALRKRHDAELEEDAADRLWVLLGQGLHKVLDMGGKDTEVPLSFIVYPDFARKYGVDIPRTVTIYGTMDRIDGRTIGDWKVT